MAGSNRFGKGNFGSAISRGDALRAMGIGAGAIATTGLGFAKGVHGQSPPNPPSSGPNANATLLNNRDRMTGQYQYAFANRYPTGTYYESSRDDYTSNTLNPFSKNNNQAYGFWDYNIGPRREINLLKPTVVNTRIHDIKFCNGTKSSLEPDGIVDHIPEPVLKTMNGVNYYEYMALLSGVGYFPAGPFYYGHYVYGPIDNNGNDVSGPVTYAQWNMMTPGQQSMVSPRNGLTYLPVYIAYPAQGWNGKLLHYLYPIHGDRYSDFAWFFPYQNNIDVQYLLKNGYAICIHLTEYGLLDSEKNINAENNRWWDESAKWLTSPYPSLDSNGLPMLNVKMPARFALVNDDGTEKCDPFSLSDGLRVSRNLGYNYPPHPPTQQVADASLARDIVHFVKNLLFHKLGRKTDFTYMFGHCSTSRLLMALNSGRACQIVWNGSNAVIDYKLNGLTPRTGGNFIVPYDPSYYVDQNKPQSNLVYNGFFDKKLFMDSVSVDPQFPITAPLITTVGTADQTNVTMTETWVINAIKATIDNPQYQLDKTYYDLNKWLRLYVIDFGTHMNRATHFATLYNGSKWFYEFGNPDGQLNQNRKGSRLNFYLGGIADALTRLNGYPPATILPQDEIVAFNSWGPLDNAWACAMEAGMIHKCIDHLDNWARDMAEHPDSPSYYLQVPKSRVWSERVLGNPYGAWVPDLPIYYWSAKQIPDNPFNQLMELPNDWPYVYWVNSKSYCSTSFPITPLWEPSGNKGIFYPTPFYLQQWVNTDPDKRTYDPLTRAAWSVSDIGPDQNGLDPFYHYVFTREIQPVMSDCCIKPVGLDDFLSNYVLMFPENFAREGIRALKLGYQAGGWGLDYIPEPIKMPNIQARLGLYVTDSNLYNVWYPYIDPFTKDKLILGYNDPYHPNQVPPQYAGYGSVTHDGKVFVDQNNYVQAVAQSVCNLVSQNLYDSNIGNAVISEAQNTPLPLKKPSYMK